MADRMSESAIERDVAAINQIDTIQTTLQVLLHATGMRIALVARVTPESWTACAVRDEAEFGLQPGQQLDLSTTF